MENGNHKKKNKQIRLSIEGEILQEYDDVKKYLGTLADAETIRVMIHHMYRFMKSGKLS